MLQLVGGNVFVYDAYKDIIYDRQKVRERFGVDPGQIVDILALAGDVSDNVPGVPGIGEKRATEIIKKYASVEKAIEQDERLKGHKKEALFYKKLLTVVTDINLALTENDIQLREINYADLLPILKELEFYSLIKELSPRLEDKADDSKSTPAAEIKIKEWLGIYFDRNLMDGNFYMSTKPKGTFGLHLEQIREFKPTLEDDKVEKIGFDLKTTVQEFHRHKINLSGPIFDVSVAAWLIDPNRKSYSVEDLSLQYLNHVVTPGNPYRTTDLALQLEPALRKRLLDLDLVDLFNNIEMELLFVLVDMEERGVRLDLNYFKKFQNELDKNLAQSESIIYQKAGHAFNLNSPKQLSQVLFEELKLQPRKKRKTHYSTSSEVLVELAQTHDVPREMLKYRELSKLKSTYVDPLLALAVNSRLHTTFNQTGTATGRLSSSNPNIQNIPIRTDLGKKIREGFVADKGCKLVSADYSQIELRILAALSKDEKLINAFTCGDDIHNQTAAKIFKVKPDQVNSYQRRVAKVVNYGIIYGMSEYGLSQELGIPQPEAQAFIENYKSIYPRVQDWIEDAIASAREKGYSETLYTRKRPLPDLKSQNRNLVEFSKRAAINTPIQGTAADIIKLAMIKIHALLKERGFKGGLLLQIHDELLFEIEETRLEEAELLIRAAMEKIVDLKIPIEVTIGAGQNWAEAH